MDKNTLEQYVNEGLSLNRMAQRSGKGATTIAYWLRKYGLKTLNICRRMGRSDKYRSGTIWTMPRDEFQSIVSSCGTIKQVIEKIGLEVCVYQYRAFHARTQADAIDTSTIDFNRCRYTAAAHAANTVGLDEVLGEDKRPIVNKSLKKKLIKAGLLTNQCAKCGIGDTWQNEPITLQLDHINGLRTDNRLENLRVLCPNCHSQTPTWGAKRRAPRPNESTVS